MSTRRGHTRTAADLSATLVVALALAAGLLSGCGGVHAQRVGDEGLWFFVHGSAVRPSDGMTAKMTGVLAVGDGCVLLDQHGIRFPVVWPSGTFVAATDPLVIQLPSGGQLALGEQVTGGGGYLSVDDAGIDVPDECLGEHGEVAVFNPDDDPALSD